MNLDEYEALQPHVTYNFDGMSIVFLTPNKQCAWRVETLDTKEPDTIAWLAKMKPGETLWDIGANMGQYSMIAAKRGLHVHAFEPESQNFALLCRNIGVNNLGDSMTAWPLALANVVGIDYFYAQNLQVGGSCSSYADPVNFHLEPKAYSVRQGCSATTGDAFSDQYGYPTHIKIDVDGLEHVVIAGMGAVLCEVQSVLVEMNTRLDQHLKIYEIMADHNLLPDTATADVARRKEGPFEGIGNVIFYRK